MKRESGIRIKISKPYYRKWVILNEWYMGWFTCKSFGWHVQSSMYEGTQERDELALPIQTFINRNAEVDLCGIQAVMKTQNEKEKKAL